MRENMRCLLVLASLAVLMSSGLVTAQRLECDCPEKYEPVCGRDSRTYPSECLPNMKYITLAQPITLVGPNTLTASAQTMECDCPEKYEPVCGRDSRTYPNECFMNCAKKSKAYDGACVRKGAFLRREPQPL